MPYSSAQQQEFGGSLEPFIVVGGPTAAGKSAVAVRLAKALNAEVLNIDSVQLYAGLEIGSAAISAEEQQGVAHHFVGSHDPAQPINAAEFVLQADQVIRAVKERCLRCIWVAGTTMYFSLLLDGIAAVGEGDPDTRALLSELSSSELYAMLRHYDRVRADELHPNDRTRVVRALEGILCEGIKPSAARRLHKEHLQSRPAIVLVLCYSRDKLYQRINERSEIMIEQGIVEESRSLLNRYGPDLAALRSVGYQQALDLLNGTLEQADLVDAVARATRRLAKMQLTFWRNEPRKRGWMVYPNDEEDSVLLRSYADEQLAGRRGVLKDFRVLRLGFEELLVRLRGRLDTPPPKTELWYLDAERLFDAGA